MRITLIDTDSGWAWGSRMISAVLKNHHHQTRIVLMKSDRPDYDAKELCALESLAADSDLIGVSCHSMGSEKARTILQHLKRLGIPTVWGGIHATLNPEECAEFADMVCLGEGEGMMVDLVACFTSASDWRAVRNLAYKDGDKVVRNPLHPLCARMDDLPLLDFSCSDEFYLVDGRLEPRSEVSEFAQEGIPFLGSRGCTFRCTYCCNGKLREIYAGSGNYVRKHSIEQCIERPATLRKSFPDGKYIFFVDDDFLDRTTEELQRFAGEFAEKVGLPFECQVSPLRVKKEKIDLLAKAGVWRIRMGVESGSERTKREVYGRPMPNEAVVRASEVLSHYPDIIRAYYFIIGNPFEGREDLLETIRLVLRLPSPFFIQPFNLIFFPGSTLYERAVAAGFIKGRQDSGYDLHYRQGLKYGGHPWKSKNLYLNALMFMMEGKVTRTRLGALPRFLVPWLLKPWFVSLNERHLASAKTMIWLKTQLLAVRSKVGIAVKRVFPHPEAIYNPGLFLKERLQQVFGFARS
jgi:anaerobic magnesium-protoporphyrin IX monomethyl ester cyclase